MQSKQYLISGVIVEATRTEGGGFYEITILSTQHKVRYLAKVFDEIAIPMGVCDDARTPHIQKDYCKNWRHV